MRHRHHSRRSMPLTSEQKKHNANIMKAVLLILAGLVIALFVYRFLAKNYLQRVREKAAADYPDAELVQLDEGASLFPDRVRAVFWDLEYGFLFVQDYRREGMKPAAEPEHPDSYSRRLAFRKICDECIKRVPEFTDAPYLIRYDTDMQGFSVLTQETEPSALNRLLNGLQSLHPSSPMRFSIVSCPDTLYRIIESGDSAAVLKDPRLAIECGTVQQGEVMLLRSCSDELRQALEGDWSNTLAYYCDTDDGVPEDYSAADHAGACSYAVTELAGKTGQETVTLRCFSINR